MVVSGSQGKEEVESCCCMGIKLQLHKTNFKDLLHNILPVVNIITLCI